ncbi:NUDIX hydrolase [Piscibacillus sp. B03]|uniref:NUDIX hydrolase n=1 Tax=Piscibacillus sp. B03 TaxID=3457430 RepID=UPI003FCEA191
MTKNNSSVVVLAKDQQNYILINQFRNPINDYTIQLPGGGVNHAEDLEEATKREFLEETGFRCAKLSYLG